MKKLLLMMLALTLALSAGAAFAATPTPPTFRVGPDEDYTSIADVLAAAEEYDPNEDDDEDGELVPVFTIMLMADLTEESETLTIDNDTPFTQITINGNGHTITAPEGVRHIVLAAPNTFTLALQNLTLNGSDEDGTPLGGGIWLQSGILSANNVTFSNNDAGLLTDTDDLTGGALHITGSKAIATLTNCKFSANSSTIGGAIHAEAGTLTISGGSFTGNGIATDNSEITTNGGAIYIASGASVTLSDTPTFTGNTASEYGGAIYTANSLNITGSAFYSNTATYGGAIHNENAADVVISGASFGNGGAASQNSAAFGGAVHTSGGSTTITATSFNLNSADLGGALYADANSVVILGESTTFTSNRATSGGAVYIPSGAQVSSTGTVTFSANNAINGGAVFASSGTSVNGLTSSVNFTGNTADYGGALYVYEQSTSLILDESKAWTFSSNTANYDGGAIYTLSADVLIDGIAITGNANTAVQGGGFLRSGGTTTVRNAQISGQSAQFGGAIYSVGSVTINNSSFTNNSATATTGTILGGGGAVYVTGSITVSSSDFSNNYNTSTYGNHGGGAIFVSGDATIEGSEFTGNIHQNSAASNTNGGGAIFLLGHMTVSHSAFASNSAAGSTSQGGAIFAHNASINITNCLFHSNKSAHNGGAVVLSGGGSSSITRCTFLDNVTTNGYGGGVYAQGNLTVTTCYFSTNRAYAEGGAVYFNQHNNAGFGAFRAEGSYFAMNSSGTSPSTNGRGGALCLSPETAVIDRCTFASNQASSANGTSYGGGVYIDMSESVSASRSSITNSVFFENAAADGATNYGAGLYTKGDILLSSNTLVNNTASGSESRGGGIFADSGTVTIKACIVVGNVSNIGRDVYCEGTITSQGYNRIGVYGKGGSNTSWLADVSGSTQEDRENSAWTSATFFGNGAQLVDSYGNHTAPEVGCSASPALLVAIFLNEDENLAQSDRATNKIPYSRRYTLNIEQYDIWGIDRFANGTDITIGATDFGSGGGGGGGGGGDGSFDIKTITMSAIPNSLKYPGQTASLIAMITYSNGEVAYGVPANATSIVLNKQERVIWSSSNANVVKVDQNGNVTALRATSGTGGVTISVQTVRNTSGGSPAIAQRVVVITDNYGYNFMNLSPEYYNYLTQNVFPILFEYDLSASIADINPSVVRSSTFRSNFAKVWSAVIPTQITDLTASTPTIAPSTAAPYLAGMTASKRAAVSINYANRSTGELFPMTYSWTFTGAEIASVMGYDMTNLRTLNVDSARAIFEKFCIAYQGNNQLIPVIGGSGISGAEAFDERALVLSYADGGAGLHVDLTVYVGNLDVTGDYDGAQVVHSSGTGRALIVPDGAADGAISGSMWMFQPASESTTPTTPTTPTTAGGSGGGGGCNGVGIGFLGAIVLFLKRYLER